MTETRKGLKRFAGTGVQFTLGISLAWAISIGFDEASWVAGVTSTPFIVWAVVLVWNLVMGLLEQGAPRRQRAADMVRAGAFVAGATAFLVYGVVMLIPGSIYPEWLASRADVHSIAELDAKEPKACANAVKHIFQSGDHWLVRCGPTMVPGKTFVSFTDPIADE